KEATMRSGSALSCLQLRDHARAVAMTFGLDVQPMKQGQPGVAERRTLWQHEMLAELETRATAGEDRRAVVEVMDRANVAAVGQHCMIQERAAVGFFGRLQFIEQPGEQLALRHIATL